MPRTTGEIIELATQIAKVPGYTQQAATLLNGILSDLTDTYDLAVARGIFNFNFNPSLTSNFGSGPYPMPLDYLRTSGSSGSYGASRSVWWTYLGVPYPMIPVDLAEFDMMVQQAGLQSFPWLWATDMSQRVVVLSTTGATLAATGPANILNPLSVQGVVPGMYVSGPGIPPLAQVVSIIGAYLPAAGGGYLPAETTGFLPAEGGAQGILINPPPTVTAAGVPLMFGYPAVGYAYVPPNGAYPVTVRYQRDMPDLPTDVNGNLLTTALETAPWFPNWEYLKTRLAADLMGPSDDQRWAAYNAEADRILAGYLKMKDDDTNRAKVVNLDRRVFGNAMPRLRNTKQVGW